MSLCDPDPAIGHDFINQLPVELLIVIFHDVLSSLGGVDRINFPITLSQVSRHWRELCITTPSLWAYMWGRKGVVQIKRIATQLARSGNHPLDVDLECGVIDPEMEELCRVLAPAMGRVKSIKFMAHIISPVRTLFSNQLGNVKMLPLLDNLELHVGYAPDLYSLLQHLSCPRIKRLYLWNMRCRPCPPLSYGSLTVLVLKNCTASIEDVSSLFREMPQIQEFQLLQVYAAIAAHPSPSGINEVPASTIIAPYLRRFSVVPNGALRTNQWEACLAVILIRALEAPQLRELVFGFVEQDNPMVQITHGAERWGVQFPKLEVLGLWHGYMDDEQLRRTLLFTFPNVQKFRFRSSRYYYVPAIVSLLVELVERGELVRLRVVDLYDVEIVVVHEALKRRMAPLTLCVRIHKTGLVRDRIRVRVRDLDLDEVVARVRDVVDLEVYEDEKEWIY